MQLENGLENLVWFLGVVEDRNDPINHGRVRVRAFGFHPPLNTNEVLTEDLPWAFLINGTGGAMISIPEEGDFVFGFFMDGRDAQHPFVLGVIHGAHYGIPYDGAIGYNAGQVDPGLAAAAGVGAARGNLVDPSNFPPLTGTQAQRAQEAMDFFVERGYTPEQAAGIVGNLIKESSLDPTAYNNSRTPRGIQEESFGLAQWNNIGSPERVANALRVMGVSDIREATFQQQLEFIDWELRNTETRADRGLRATTTASEAAEVFDRLYERSDGSARAAGVPQSAAESVLRDFRR